MSKKSFDKVLESLAGMLPAQEREKTNGIISEFMNETVSSLQSEYEDKLEAEKEKFAVALQEAEAVALQGYNEAAEIITDLRNRSEKQREELEAQQEEGYQEAFDMIVAERKKNELLEMSLYEEYEKKLDDVKEYIVEMVHKFLVSKGEEYYESAKKEVMNDPCLVEHKLAWNKVLNLAAGWLSDKDLVAATSDKSDEMQRQMDEQRQQIKMLEAKNTRLSMDKDRLNESIRQMQDVITEDTKKEERAKKVKNAEGRGLVVERRMEIIPEVESTKRPAQEEDEMISEDVVRHLNDWKRLINYDGQ